MKITIETLPVIHHRDGWKIHHTYEGAIPAIVVTNGDSSSVRTFDSTTEQTAVLDEIVSFINQLT